MNDENIIERLRSHGVAAESAWREFLHLYSRLFLKVIWQFEKDHDGAMEKYVYVCEQFAANNFEILRRFKAAYGPQPPKFSTWLAAVARNLCVDAHRKSHGRKQLPRMMRGMSNLERSIFQQYYWKGCSVEEIRSTVGSFSIQQTGDDIDEVINRVIMLGDGITRRASAPSFVPFDEQQAITAQDEHDYEMADVQRWLELWMQELSAQEKMILRLRFWEGMSGKEIAGAMRIVPEQRVYPLIQNALRHLREKAKEIEK
jgi:RNA polymerase sigma factor (sigma-70 family)